jgi:hypothetical protein
LDEVASLDQVSNVSLKICVGCKSVEFFNKSTLINACGRAGFNDSFAKASQGAITEPGLESTSLLSGSRIAAHAMMAIGSWVAGEWAAAVVVDNVTGWSLDFFLFFVWLHIIFPSNYVDT